MLANIKAFIQDKRTVTVHLNKKFYDGKSSFFRLRTSDGFSKELPIVDVCEKDEYIVYNLRNKYFDLTKEFVISDEHNMTTPLEVGFYVRSKEFNKDYYYDGDDLGVTYTKEKSIFKVWTPIASEVILKINQQFIPMERLDKGVYKAAVFEDCELYEYTYLVKINGSWQEAIDPYAYSSTPNGLKSVVVDLKKCKLNLYPKKLKPLENNVDAVIYELHIRDFSVSESSNLINKGKYLAFEETGVLTNANNPSGIDYLASLGVSHIQLLPFYDFGSVDELNQFDYYNWGYDPMQYNVPEGSYASDVSNPYSRILDCKRMIAAIHKKGLRVVMDVVYNHMFGIDVTAFHKLMPNYYFRYGDNGEVSNGSFCGNDFDSMMPMASKYIVDSVKRWTKFYGVDGFRFDLMGILDIKTMNKIFEEASALNPNMIIYGEGWNMPTILDDKSKACQFNNKKLLNIGFFNDRFRDIVKGATFASDAEVKGYATGAKGKEKIIEDVLKGTVQEVSYGYNYQSPNQVINYVECHDNHTIWDKMAYCCREEDDETKLKRSMLMTAMVVLAQGVPFIHAGQEFGRTKNLDHNSYMSSDKINQFDYDLKDQNVIAVKYLQALIKFRKTHQEFRLKTTKDINKLVKTTSNRNGVVKYFVGDYLVIFNPNNKPCKVIFNEEYDLIDLNDKVITSNLKGYTLDSISTTLFKVNK